MPMPGHHATVPPYRPPRLFTGRHSIDAALAVWYGACDKSGPPSWGKLSDLIWHPWFMNLLMVESRHRMKPAQCIKSFPVATALLGLPMWFGGTLPLDNPQTAALSSIVRVVSMRRRPVFKLLPPVSETAGSARRLYVVGMPLADSMSDMVPYRLERVLFAVTDADGRSSPVITGASTAPA
jgi:hypothetical protein